MSQNSLRLLGVHPWSPSSILLYRAVVNSPARRMGAFNLHAGYMGKNQLASASAALFMSRKLTGGEPLAVTGWFLSHLCRYVKSPADRPVCAYICPAPGL